MPTVGWGDILVASNKKTCSVESVEEYIKTLRDILTNERTAVFRGHSNKEWKLLSSGDRNELKSGDYQDIWLEGYKHNYDTIKTENFIDAVVNMQHYMIPTKLLDWTYNPLVALYFVVEQNPDDDGEVIVAYPRTIYEPDLEETKTLSRYLKKIYHNENTFEEEMNLFRLLHCDKNMFFCVTKSNERIQAQAGLFSLHLDISKTDIAKKTENELMDILRNKPSDSEMNNKSEEIKRGYEKIKKAYIDSHKRDEWNTDFFFYMDNNERRLEKEYSIIHDVLAKLRKSWIWDYYKFYHINIEVENKRIEIPAKYKPGIAEDLKRFCNIHARTIYPDFPGYTEYIRNRYSHKISNQELTGLNLTDFEPLMR